MDSLMCLTLVTCPLVSGGLGVLVPAVEAVLGPGLGVGGGDLDDHWLGHNYSYNLKVAEKVS